MALSRSLKNIMQKYHPFKGGQLGGGQQPGGLESPVKPRISPGLQGPQRGAPIKQPVDPRLRQAASRTDVAPQVPTFGRQTPGSFGGPAQPRRRPSRRRMFK